MTKPGDLVPESGNDEDMTALLLPGMPAMPERPPGDDRSKRRSWTTRARAMVAAGIHPLTRLKTYPERGTCGTCRNWQRETYHVRGYRKCALGPSSHSEQTDVRGWWPACHRYEAAHLPGESQGVPDLNVSMDAARWVPPPGLTRSTR